MDVKFWIWLVVIVVTLIARASKKKTPAAIPDRNRDAVPEDDSRTPAYPEAARPQSFEELLREIQASKSKPEVMTASREKYDFEEYDRVKKIERPLEDTQYDYRKHDSIYDTYDNAKKEAFQRPSLEETLKLQDTVIRFNPFKGYQQMEVRNLAAEFGKEIQNPANFKKAFIMSEILQRRF